MMLTSMEIQRVDALAHGFIDPFHFLHLSKFGNLFQASA